METVNDCIKKYELFEEAVCFRGKIYIGMGYYHKAEVDFKSIINHTSKPSFLCFVGLADCFRFQGKPDKALSSYYRAFESLNIKENSRDIGHKQ